ncbi:TPA: Lar family restriction alleviation protein [Pluralibacter gergoviae]|nr:Lar family restriction alleviation protein [Pluralibacter gergoviae]HDS1241439.1 Lar family restriction alleviation protein [Pluralibacter gergoviae]HDS1248962.1 Lar family restriction alleviation protein [Pluralibacter gergoviae]HDS1254154.1 Lar family restriction alleviation protein [Pluralibacter gergoviae]HDS1257625.1 Lar family restriction alleviation protein [Pluralibacter gergoviae]
MIYDLKLPQWASLLGCPFCGGTAELSADGDGVFAGCSNRQCAINPITQTYRTKREAVRAWNRRAS